MIPDARLFPRAGSQIDSANLDTMKLIRHIMCRGGASEMWAWKPLKPEDEYGSAPSLVDT